MNERFARNMAALAVVAPDLHRHVDAFDTPLGRIVAQPGDAADINLEFDGRLLYDGGYGARRHAVLQVDGYRAAPARLTVMPPPGNDMPSDVTDLVRGPVDAAVARCGAAPEAAIDHRGATFIVFGVGLGDHIGLLLDHFQFRNLVLIEPFIELVWHSLHLQDWAAWLDELARRGGSILLLGGDDPAATASELRRWLNLHCHTMLHGSYMYRHYDSMPLEQARERVEHEFQSQFLNSRGFFEDQIIMLVNATRNLARGTDRLILDRPLPAQPVPAIIVAAGPSLDKAMPDLIRLRNQAVVFCAGSTLGTLLRHGVVPDFQCDIENTAENYECIAWAAEAGDISSIRLVASATVDERMPGLFEQSLLYIRDQMVTTPLYGTGERTVPGTAPNCLTLALRMAIHFGFHEIYLIGTDFGSRRPDRHHVSDSIWMTNPEWRARYDAIPDPMAIVTPGNFGGRCFTNRLLHGFLRSAEEILAAFPDVQVFNCSDGVRVAGTTAKLAAQVRLDTSRQACLQVLDPIVAETTISTAGIVSPAVLRAFQTDYRDWSQGLASQIAGWRAEGDDLIELHDVLLAALQPADGVIAALVHGSLMSAFQYAFHHAVTWHLDSDAGLLDAVALGFDAMLRSMQRDFDAAVDAALASPAPRPVS